MVLGHIPIDGQPIAVQGYHANGFLFDLKQRSRQNGLALIGSAGKQGGPYHIPQLLLAEHQRIYLGQSRHGGVILPGDARYREPHLAGYHLYTLTSGLNEYLSRRQPAYHIGKQPAGHHDFAGLLHHSRQAGVDADIQIAAG